MTNKQLYFIIALLFVVLLYVLFVPTEDVEAPDSVPDQQKDAIQVVVDETLAVEGVSQKKIEITEEVEEILIEGTFVGLLTSEDSLKKKFTYLLLTDAEEVLRIDLRPLIGYSDINIIEKLGVERGDEVRVFGTMQDGEFTVEAIE